MTALPQEGGRPTVVHPAVRYGELTPPDRHLLLVLEAQGGTAGEAILTRLLDLTPDALQGRLRGLAALGLVEAADAGWALPEALRPRVQRDLNMVAGARLVTSCARRLRLPRLSAGERVLGQLCREVFAPHPVAARVPLRRVLDVQVMNSLLDADDRTFLAHGSAHLDLLVEDHVTAAPLLALELDGPQHQESPQRERDGRKDRILRIAGLPLLRLWTDEPEPPREGLLRSLLGWRLREALRDPGFLAACPPALEAAPRRMKGEES